MLPPVASKDDSQGKRFAPPKATAKIGRESFSSKFNLLNARRGLESRLFEAERKFEKVLLNDRS
jgi:hypothetical protein